MERQSLKRFLSSLALAEKAAAEQCSLAADHFEKAGQTELAENYRQFAREENGHFELIRSLVDGELETTSKAKKVYDGHLLRDKNSLLERLAAVHLAFEPSALSYLGYLYNNCAKLIDDPILALKAKVAFGSILKEEVAHINYGKNLVRKMMNESSEETRENVRQSLRLHQAFLSLGLRSFFKDKSDDFVVSMLNNYHQRTEAIDRELAAL